MAAQIEIPIFVNKETLERAYSLAFRFRRQQVYGIAAQGLRAARARDPRLMLALEKGAVILRDMSEDQFGKSGMKLGGKAGSVEATEYQAWRNAYTVLADSMDDETRNEAVKPYDWLYAAAGILAGIII